MHTDKLWRDILSSGRLLPRNVLRQSSGGAGKSVIPAIRFVKNYQKRSIAFKQNLGPYSMPRRASVKSHIFPEGSPGTHFENKSESAFRFGRNQNQFFEIRARRENFIHFLQTKSQKSGGSVLQKNRKNMQAVGVKKPSVKLRKARENSVAAGSFSENMRVSHSNSTLHVFPRDMSVSGRIFRPEIRHRAIDTRSAPAVKISMPGLENCSAVPSQFRPISLEKMGRVRQPEFEENDPTQPSHFSRLEMPPFDKGKRREACDSGKMARLAARRAMGGVDEIQFPQYPGRSIGIG
ncbi:hypothetical protein [Gluconobacter sp. P5B12]|uniref:hypothetical protein n=1 Tax=unclassified Gluconobacter TaxID=2644261 RepID=UPI001C0489F5|nr:hypothetical protein [Gluconobacter sp. P5B12]